MIESARLQLKLDAFICRLSEFVVHIDEVDVKVSFAYVEIVVPDLDAKHEISAVSAFWVECELQWIVGIGATAGGCDAHHVEGVEYLVWEDSHQRHNQKNGHAPSEDSSVLWLLSIS